MICKKYWLFGGVLGFFWSINPAYGQIIPDGTTNTPSVSNCQSSCHITGGNIAGDNLFHSFQDFNIGAGERVYFNDPGVTNIFSRVTGSNSSQIFGLLGVSGGNADLWLLNPNGILFGAGTTLDLNGSFVATTADEIQFADNNSFSAIPTAQENLALLTVNPTALFFNQMGQNHSITVDSGALLTVPPQQNITLLGGQTNSTQPGVSISNSSFLQAPQGNVSIGVFKSGGKIDLSPDLKLSFPNDAMKGDISLTEGSGIDASGVGGGNILLQGNNITLSGKSNLYARTTGHIDGGSIEILANNLTIAKGSTISTNTIGRGKSSQINITAIESVNLVGEDIGKLQKLFDSSLSQSSSEVEIDSTSINSIAALDGASGDITIRSQDLNLSNGAWILSTTTGTKSAGNITVDVRGDINLDGSALSTGVGIGSKGNAGSLNISSNNLFLQNGSAISSSTLGSGNGGDINLNVANLVRLRQSLPNRAIPTGIFSNTILGDGTAGNLTINTSKLILNDGAELSSASGALIDDGLISFGGKGGNITVNATDSIQITGVSSDFRFPSGIVNSTFSDRPAGNIEIHTNKLSLQDEAIISASSIGGSGDGGNLTIVSNESINLKGNGFENLQALYIRGFSGELEFKNLTGGLFTNTQIGKAGNTKIVSPSLTLENGALISTSTFGEANGGNIDIFSEDIKVTSSLLASSTINGGHAGNITIETDRLATANSGLITTSSTGLGNAGGLKVTATDSIELVDVDNTNLIFGGLITNSLGLSYPGNLEVNTKNLTIAGGAKISASNARQYQLFGNTSDIDISLEQFRSKPAKNIVINAESIAISGVSTNQFFTSGITSATSTVFPASNIEINTSELAIADRAEVEVSSFGEGEAGNLKIKADRIFLTDRGVLNASTLSGKGGNIDLQIEDVLSLNNSKIQTDALNVGDGGNILVDTKFVIASDGSNISANALSGNGGNIDIATKDLLIAPDSQITASSQLGIDGEVNIKTFNTSDRNSLVELPDKIMQADSSISKSCGNGDRQNNVFSYTGRGGLPPSLLTEYHLGDRSLIPDFALNDNLSANKDLNLGRTQINSFPQATVEASSWKINHHGKVELVARTEPHTISNILDIAQCPWRS